MQEKAVHIKSVVKNFGESRVLKGVSLDIKPGEFFSILGPSGCGKTTLLRIIAGFENPDEGSIFLGADDVSGLPAHQRKTNTIFQNYALFPHLSVFENVAFALRLKKEPEVKIKEQVAYFLNLVQLFSHADKYPSQLSGGQKQRVAIARAMINQPAVLLLDEPLSALDAKLRQQLLVDLDTLHDTTGITFIYVTHDQHEALSVSDRVAVMHEGNVLQVGTPAEIYEAPANTFVADFIGETNFLEGIVQTSQGRYGTCLVPALNQTLKFELDKPVTPGKGIKLTIRPEKIRVMRECGADIRNNPELNILSGIVDEIIYQGFQSKFFIQIGSQLLKAFKPHMNYFEKESAINWKEDVYLVWSADDSFIVEVVE